MVLDVVALRRLALALGPAGQQDPHQGPHQDPHQGPHQHPHQAQAPAQGRDTAARLLGPAADFDLLESHVADMTDKVRAPPSRMYNIP